jgi:hypothetical protein
MYPWAPQDLQELERLLEKWFSDDNRLNQLNRLNPHTALGGVTPREVYRPKDTKPWERVA